MNRRELLTTAAGLALPAPAAATRGFRHRGYLGWITDLATMADTYAEWPSMRIDEPLLRDYRDTCGVLHELGFEDLCVWGLYVSRAWPVEIASAVSPERAKMVDRLIAAARAKNLRVISGLGVYSWGFEEILRARPHLRKTANRSAMCGSEDESWDWMRKVIDYVFTRFPIDGVSMQSADQGRCTCEKCQRYSETEYHAMLNIRCARYIRSRWPGKGVAVSGWGMRFEDAANLPHLVELSRHIDYLIDVRDSSRHKDPALRARLASSLQCAFGTLGGPQVEPPQHWARDRWFLPTVAGAAGHLQSLYMDGGRACEWFYHILANPGCELTTWVVGRTLADPATPWRKHLERSVERIYKTRSTVTRDALCEAFLAAELAYTRYLPEQFCGTISLEPLVSAKPGPPIYLTRNMTAAQRSAFAEALLPVHAQFGTLAKSIPGNRRMAHILRGIENMRRDAMGA